MKNRVETVLILDDHEVVSGGLTALVSGQYPEAVLTVASTLSDMAQVPDRFDFDLYFLDISLQDGSGIECLKELRSARASGKIIVFTGSATTLDLVSAEELDADAIVSKAEPIEVVLEAMSSVIAGRRFLSPMISDELQKGPAELGLTPRMVDVLRLLAEGAANKEIAYRLDMAETAVSFHLRNLRQRLGAANNREIIRKARSHGFL